MAFFPLLIMLFIRASVTSVRLCSLSPLYLRRTGRSKSAYALFSTANGRDELTELNTKVRALEFCLKEGSSAIIPDDIREDVLIYGRDDKSFLRSQLTLVKAKELLLLMKSLSKSEVPATGKQNVLESTYATTFKGASPPASTSSVHTVGYLDLLGQLTNNSVGELNYKDAGGPLYAGQDSSQIHLRDLLVGITAGKDGGGQEQEKLKELSSEIIKTGEEIQLSIGDREDMELVKGGRQSPPEGSIEGGDYLATLAKCCRGVGKTIHDEDMTKTTILMLIDVMRTYGYASADVAEACCVGIRNLVKQDINYTYYLDEPIEIEVMRAAAAALLDALRVHGRNSAAMAGSCCDALCEIEHRYYSDRCEAEKQAAPDRGGIISTVPGVCEVIIDVLRAHGTSETDAAYQCARTLTDAIGDESRADFGSTDVFSVIFDIIKAQGKTDSHTSRLILNECYRSINEICKNNAANKAKFNELNTIRLLLLDDARLPLCNYHPVTDAIAALKGIDEIEAQNDLKILSTVLQEYIDKPGVVSRCLIALSDPMAAVPGPMELIANVLQEHGGADAAVAELCSVTIEKMCQYDKGAKNRVKFESTDVFSALVNVLKAHGKVGTEATSQRALDACCSAIGSLCEDNAANIARFNELNTIQLLLYEVDSSEKKKKPLGMLLGVNCVRTEEDVLRLKDVLIEYMDNPVVLTACQNTMQRNSFKTPGLLDEIANVLRSHGRANPLLAQICCEAIAIMTNTYNCYKLKYESDDVPSILTDILKAYGKTDTEPSKRVLNHCCEAIENMCENICEAKSEFNRLKTIQVLEKKVTVLDSEEKRAAIEAIRLTVAK